VSASALSAGNPAAAMRLTPLSGAGQGAGPTFSSSRGGLAVGAAAEPVELPERVEFEDVPQAAGDAVATASATHAAPLLRRDPGTRGRYRPPTGRRICPLIRHHPPG